MEVIIYYIMDVEKILYKLQEFNYVRLHKINGNYFTIYCPIHNGGQERKPSCGVLLHEQYKNGGKYPEGFCHCFSCGYHDTLPNMITKILETRNISKSGLDWLNENIPGFEVDAELESLIPQDMMQALNSSFAINYIKAQTSSRDKHYVTEEELSKYRFTVPYMYERGLTDELIEKYDIGFDADYIPPGRKKKLPCITFPVRDLQGNTLFLCRRSVEGKFFNYPRDVEKPVYGLYELPPNVKRVTICESCFNALTSIKYGEYAVALLGTGTPYQMKQLRESGISEFILGFDPDEAGKRAVAKWKRALSDVGIVWTYEGIPEGKDINDLSYDEFKNLNLV